MPNAKHHHTAGGRVITLPSPLPPAPWYAYAGGKLTQQAGSWRIGAAGLQVTRSLGDFDVKGALSGGGVGVGGGGGCGVTAEPEVSVTALRDDDLFLVLATDGLWDVITSEEAVGLVRDTVKDPVMCSKRLVTEALARGSLDNVTAAVIFLRPVSTLERIFSDGRESHEVTRTHHGTRGAARANAPPPRQPTADEMRDTY